jgi:glycosyltransferase involved in cell wall biosynthesis
MDMRDAMAVDPNRPTGRFGRFQTTIERVYEQSFYRAADAVVVVSDPMKESILSRYTTSDIAAKTHVIMNGFDEEDFSRIQSGTRKRSKLSVTYTGSFMGRQNPESFLAALHRLVQEHRIEAGDLRIRFVGHFDPSALALFRRYSTDLPLEITGFKPHETCLRLQVDSELLLLIVNISRDEGGNQTMTGKFFEYVGAQRPIFALVPEGPLKRTIVEGRFGYTVAPQDIAAIGEKFKSVYDQWRLHGRIDYDPDVDRRVLFTRRHLTHKLANLVDSLDPARR